MKTNTANNNPLFSAGRIGRLAYAAWLCVFTLTAMTVFVTLAVTAGTVITNLNSITGFSMGVGMVALLVYAVWLYFNFVLTIKRLHDSNKTGWLSLLLLVPFINIVFAFYIVFAKGTEGDNDYGTPRPTAGWEKILGWIYFLLIPASLFYLWGNVSTTAYQDYLERAQMQPVDVVQVEQEAYSTIVNNTHDDD